MDEGAGMRRSLILNLSDTYFAFFFDPEEDMDMVNIIDKEIWDKEKRWDICNDSEDLGRDVSEVTDKEVVLMELMDCSYEWEGDHFNRDDVTAYLLSLGATKNDEILNY